MKLCWWYEECRCWYNYIKVLSICDVKCIWILKDTLIRRYYEKYNNYKDMYDSRYEILEKYGGNMIASTIIFFCLFLQGNTSRNAWDVFKDNVVFLYCQKYILQ